MSEQLIDRILKIQKAAQEDHMALDLCFDPVTETWTAWDGEDDLTDPADSFEGMIEALETDFRL